MTLLDQLRAEYKQHQERITQFSNDAEERAASRDASTLAIVIGGNILCVASLIITAVLFYFGVL